MKAWLKPIIIVLCSFGLWTFLSHYLSNLAVAGTYPFSHLVGQLLLFLLIGYVLYRGRKQFGIRFYQRRLNTEEQAHFEAIQDTYWRVVRSLAPGYWRSWLAMYRVNWVMVLADPDYDFQEQLTNSGVAVKAAFQGLQAGNQDISWYVTDLTVYMVVSPAFCFKSAHSPAVCPLLTEFLWFFRRVRLWSPITSLLVVLNAPAVLMQTETVLKQLQFRLRAMIDAVGQVNLGQLPVYLVGAQAEGFEGFMDFFLALTDRHSQDEVLGVTLPLQQGHDGKTVCDFFEERYQRWLKQLEPHQLFSLQAEAAAKTNLSVYHFVTLLQRLAPILKNLVQQSLYQSHYLRRIRFRGFYLLAKASGEDAKVVFPFSRAFFEKVLTPEARLNNFVQVSLRFCERFRKALGIGVIALSTILISVWIAGYAQATAYLNQTQEQVLNFQDLVMALKTHRHEGAWQARALSDLTKLKAETNALYGRWWHYFGLPFPERVAGMSEAMYHQALVTYFLPFIQQVLANQLQAQVAQQKPQMTQSEQLAFDSKIYQYLSSYLMLTQVSHLNSRQVESQLAGVWQQLFPQHSATYEQLVQLTCDLLAKPIPALASDAGLVAKARAAFGHPPLATQVFYTLQMAYQQKAKPLAIFGDSLPLVFHHQSGLSLSVNAFDTQAGWGYLNQHLADAITYAKDETWVLGANAITKFNDGDLATTEQAVKLLFLQTFVANWQQALMGVEVAPVKDIGALEKQLVALSGDQSPLLSAVQQVTTQWPQAIDGIELSPQMLAYQTTVTALTPDQVNQLSDTLQLLSESVKVISQSSHSEEAAYQTLVGWYQKENNPLQTFRQLSQSLPAPFATWLQQILTNTVQITWQLAESYIQAQWQNLVYPQCTALLSGHYPLSQDAAADLTPHQLAQLYGKSGLAMSFAKTYLRPFMLLSERGQWEMRPIGGVRLAQTKTLTQQMNAAYLITKTLYTTAGEPKSVELSWTPLLLSKDIADYDLAYDGHTLQYQNGPRVTQALHWPAQQTEGNVVVRYTDLTGQSSEHTYYGSWGLIQLLGTASIIPLQGDTYTVSMPLAPNTYANYAVKVVGEGSLAGLVALSHLNCELGAT